jgi:hypothetical protein
MGKQTRGTLLMVLAFLLVGAATWIVAKGSGTENQSQEDALKPYIFTFDPQQVLWLEMTDHENDSSCMLEKENDQWWTKGASRSRAGDTEVMGLVGQISMLKSNRVIPEDDVDLESFGLADPSFELRLGFRSGEETNLLIGTVSPNGLFYYAIRPPDTEGYTVPLRTIDNIKSLSRELCAELTSNSSS